MWASHRASFEQPPAMAGAPPVLQMDVCSPMGLHGSGHSCLMLGCTVGCKGSLLQPLGPPIPFLPTDPGSCGAVSLTCSPSSLTAVVHSAFPTLLNKYIMPEVLPLWVVDIPLTGLGLASSKSILGLAGIDSVGHAGGLWQLLRSPPLELPPDQNFTTQTQYTGRGAQHLSLPFLSSGSCKEATPQASFLQT